MEMSEFREPMPIVSGPGAFLISLIFIALILTSSESRDLAFNWQFAVALVAISLPISILITQIFHAFLTKFGYRMKNWGEKYTKYKKKMYILDSMVDYLSWRESKGEKEWRIIQKRASAYWLVSMLLYVSVFFLLGYTIAVLNLLSGNIPVCWWGVGLTYLITILCVILFWLAREDIWKAYMILDRKIIKDIESELDTWIKTEIKEDNDNVNNTSRKLPGFVSFFLGILFGTLGNFLVACWLVWYSPTKVAQQGFFIILFTLVFWAIGFLIVLCLLYRRT
jgi:hypothetical protein